MKFKKNKLKKCHNQIDYEIFKVLTNEKMDMIKH